MDKYKRMYKTFFSFLLLSSLKDKRLYTETVTIFCCYVYNIYGCKIYNNKNTKEGRGKGDNTEAQYIIHWN